MTSSKISAGATGAGRDNTIAVGEPEPKTSSNMTTTPMPEGALGLVFHSFLSFVICSVDRINLSVAIIPMSKIFNWSATRQGLIQSVFFIGYMTTQILSGRLADERGGRFILATGVFIWSICTALIPLSAPVLPALLAVRVALGAGEGVAMPSMNQIISAAVPARFRARSLAFIYSGMYVGSIVGLIVTPFLLKIADFRAAFYVFAVAGVIWVAIFVATTADPQQLNKDQAVTEDDFDPSLSPSYLLSAKLPFSPESPTASESLLSVEGGITSNVLSSRRPSMREIFVSRAMWAIIVAHFCCTWGYFVLLAWLPSYLNSRFNLDVSASALYSTLPWFAMFLFSNVGGFVADGMLAARFDVTFVRKTVQGIGFVGPALFLTLLMFAENVTFAIICIAAALATSAFSQSGVYANHQDIGPEVAGTLLGISSTFASIPGLIGVYVTGVILDHTGYNWNAVFATASFFYFLGFVVYTAAATSERIW